LYKYKKILFLTFKFNIMKKLFLSIATFFCLLVMAQAQNTSPYWSLAGNSNATSTSKLGTTNAINLRLFTNNLERMRINTSGNVGIGTTGPNAKLHINSAIGQDALRVQVNAATKLLVHRDGGVAIGTNTTPPANGLLVNGDLRVNKEILVRNVIEVGEGPSDGGYGGTGIDVRAGETGIRVSAYDLVSGTGIDADGGTTGVSGHGKIFGIFGTSDDTGVHGRGTNYGTGVDGISTNGLGGRFESYNGTALSARTTSGFYAATFYGNTWASGTYYGSDKNIKKNVREVGNALSIINQLKPRYYEFRDDGKYAALNLPKGNHYGLLAQDVEEVLPNLVKESPHELRTVKPIPPMNSTADGKTARLALRSAQKEPTENINIKAVNYIELIPIVIKAMQEQQATIEKQNAKIEELTQLVNKLSLNPNAVPSEKLTGAFLGQCTPNPNSTRTRISYNLPVQFTGAELIISNNTGQQVKQISLNNTGLVEVDTSALSTGTYFYSLYVEGQLIDTKKMIVTR
jgi:hypothetical protein